MSAANITTEQWNDLMARTAREVEVTGSLLKKNPSLGFVNALVMAGDICSAERATELVKLGMKPREALNHVGSYARFQWAIDNLPRKLRSPRLF